MTSDFNNTLDKASVVVRGRHTCQFSVLASVLEESVVPSSREAACESLASGRSLLLESLHMLVRLACRLVLAAIASVQA